MKKPAHWLMILGCVAIAAIVTFVVITRVQHEPFERLTTAQRRELYEGNIAHFNRMCESQPVIRIMSGFCREQAELLRRFPECDGDCIKKTAPYFPGPSR